MVDYIVVYSHILANRFVRLDTMTIRTRSMQDLQAIFAERTADLVDAKVVRITTLWSRHGV